MPAIKKDLYVEQGSTYRLGLQWVTLSDEPGEPAEPVDLTGYKARLQMRKAQQQPALISASTETGEFEIDGPTGTVRLVLSPDQTNDLSIKSLKYDLEVESPDGEVDRLLEGSVTVSPNITQMVDEPVVTE